MMDEHRLQASLDRSEIINLISKSILTRDSGLWEQLADCYHSEAEFTSSWCKGSPAGFFAVAERKLNAARREGGEQKHVTSNHWIEIKGERAVAECDLILFLRRPVKGVELDFATFSRRLQLVAREDGEWKIYRRWMIYEKDRMDVVDPTIPVDAYYDPEALANYPKTLRHHLWRNEVHGSPPERHIVLRGTSEEKAARDAARLRLDGGQPIPSLPQHRDIPVGNP